jgi:hypothetical protein
LEHKKNIVPFLFQESSGPQYVSLENDPEKYPLVNPGSPERTKMTPDGKPASGIAIGSTQCKASHRVGWGRRPLGVVRYRQDIPSAIEGPQKPHSVGGLACPFAYCDPWACNSPRSANNMAPARRIADSRIKGLFRMSLICP